SGGDAIEVLRTAERVGVLDSHILRWCLQALLCGRPDEWQRFDELFDAWFLPANRWQAPEQREAEGGVAHAGAVRDPNDGEEFDEGRDQDRPESAASSQEALASADFSTLTRREHTLD